MPHDASLLIGMTAREQEEYRALRETVRERGTARIWVFVGGIAAWAAAVFASAAIAAPPVTTLLPLLILASAFEGIYALHVGVERIGRYLQVFFEAEAETARWEHAAMAFGTPKGAARLDPLFCIPFLLAAVFNVMPALIAAPTNSELLFIGAAHALFVLRLVVARDIARKQRRIDLSRFQELRR